MLALSHHDSSAAAQHRRELSGFVKDRYAYAYAYAYSGLAVNESERSDGPAFSFSFIPCAQLRYTFLCAEKDDSRSQSQSPHPFQLSSLSSLSALRVCLLCLSASPSHIQCHNNGASVIVVLAVGARRPVGARVLPGPVGAALVAGDKVCCENEVRHLAVLVEV